MVWDTNEIHDSALLRSNFYIKFGSLMSVRKGQFSTPKNFDLKQKFNLIDILLKEGK